MHKVSPLSTSNQYPYLGWVGEQFSQYPPSFQRLWGQLRLLSFSIYKGNYLKLWSIVDLREFMGVHEEPTFIILRRGGGQFPPCPHVSIGSEDNCFCCPSPSTRDNTWKIRCLVNEAFAPASHLASVLYCRLSDLKNTHGSSMRRLM